MTSLESIKAVLESAIREKKRELSEIAVKVEQESVLPYSQKEEAESAALINNYKNEEKNRVNNAVNKFREEQLSAAQEITIAKHDKGILVLEKAIESLTLIEEEKENGNTID